MKTETCIVLLLLTTAIISGCLQSELKPVDVKEPQIKTIDVKKVAWREPNVLDFIIEAKIEGISDSAKLKSSSGFFISIGIDGYYPQVRYANGGEADASWGLHNGENLITIYPDETMLERLTTKKPLVLTIKAETANKPPVEVLRKIIELESPPQRT